jgi:LysR family transcriptional regulator, glycine cleavage system transcriptional activator
LEKSVKKPATRRRASAKATTFRRAPIGSLRVFAAVAQQLSVSRAADALGVTASAVSMQLKSLEDYLQLPLLRRRGRNLVLTPEGERLLPRVERGLRELEEAIDGARGDRCEGQISVTTLASFMQQWLMPRLPDFQSRHPKLELTVHTSAEAVDLRQSRLQAAIRMGRGHWPGLHAEKLLDEWLVLVCAPALLARHGPVRTAADLRRYRLVHSTSEPWSSWLLDHDDQRDLARTALFDDSVTVIRAAEAGQGMALARWSLVESELRLGRLVLAGERVVQSEFSYYFACLPEYQNVEKVRLLRQWLVEEARSFPPPPGARPR